MPPGYPSVDNWPEWSNDGQWIAFQRRFPSSYGPPGLYITSVEGGTPRFLAAGDFWWPQHIRFSRDDRYIVCVRGISGLVIVEVATGIVREPVYTERGVRSPSWSPDGSKIVYVRTGYSYDVPLDSLGFYVLDLSTGTQRSLRFEAQPVFGDFPVWSDDGQEIAYLEYFSTMEENSEKSWLSVYSLSDSTSRRLIESTGWKHGLRRHVRRSRGLDGLAFTGTLSHGRAAYFVRWGSSEYSRLRSPYTYEDGFSPDGMLSCGSWFSRTDSLALLFVFSPEDVSGATQRQLTFYAPQSSSVAAPRSSTTRMLP